MGIIRLLISIIMKLLGMGKSSSVELPAVAGSGGGGAASRRPPESSFDLAGFDPANDENGFFEAVLHMETDGMGGGTEESRARIMAKYRIADRMHWQTVRASVYQALTDKYGSLGDVMQREMNYRQSLSQQQMSAQIAQKSATGEMAPVEGVSLTQWAAINAAIVQGVSLEDMLKGNGIDMARWDRVRTEWEARMARDTTFAIAQVYGDAFQNASKGKYSAQAKDVAAARSANRDLSQPPPMSVEDYWRVLYEQSYASKMGKDPAQALKACGLSITDWVDLSAIMGYHIQRTWGPNVQQYQAVMKKVDEEYKAKYPGVNADVDISF